MSVSELYAIKPYSHRLDRDSFRLMFLERGGWDLPLRCQLVTKKLMEVSGYQALFYAWGSPAVTRPIIVNDMNMTITINLDIALRRLRREDSDILLWVDALCINQADLDEREAQVQIMSQIYRRAENVIVFLGDGTTHASGRLQESRPQGFLFHDDLYDSQYVAQFLSCCRTMPIHNIYKGFGIFCLISLVVLQYGCSVAPLELFIRAARNIQILNMKNSLYKKLSSDNIKVLRWFAENLINIQESRRLHTSASYGNTDKYSVDRVYALLGLLPVNLGISPNYRVATPWVYTEVIRNIIAATRSLDVFCGDLGRKNRGDLQSWVPDWSAISHNEEIRRTKVTTILIRDGVHEIFDQLGLHSWHPPTSKDEMDKRPADEKTTYRPQFGRLNITGLRISRIRYHSDQFFDLTDVRRLKSLIIQWLNKPFENLIITQIHTHTLRYLVFDLKFVSGEFKRLEDGDERHLRMWFDAKTSSDNQAYQDILAFDYVLKFMSTRRRLFLNDNNTLGWGPDGLKAHDIIYVLPGGRTPYVLRNADHRIFYMKIDMEMIGDFYLHDAMDGKYLKLSNTTDQATRIIQEDCRYEFTDIERLFRREFHDIISKYALDIRDQILNYLDYPACLV
ncbi:heterokaryon incompatibility protein-domain-containing protein [Daldinia loculata]|nr:heterokaryon incompatibility protein-domain-containing protein [Daldinia loculata]